MENRNAMDADGLGRQSEGGSPHMAENEEDRRPTPVREVMEVEEEEDRAGEEDHRRFKEGEEGQEWIVTVSGRSAGGVLPLRTIPLMELAFAKVEEPSQFLRKTVCQGTDLGELPDHEIRSLLQGSEPFRKSMKEPDGGEGDDRRRRNRGN